jgi:hypothetical protein
VCFDDVVQDVRHGVRILRNSPGFAATAAVSLAIATDGDLGEQLTKSLTEDQENRRSGGKTDD